MHHTHMSYGIASTNGHDVCEAALRQLATLAGRIVELRERLDLSQQDVADHTRLSQQHVSRVEQGMNCNMLTFLKVCQALEITVELEEGERV